MTTDNLQQPPADDAIPLEISPTTAAEMIHLDLACLIDIRQPFELEFKGALPNSLHIPFFNIKRAFGDPLSDEEQEILDSEEPSDIDIKAFVKRVNTLQRQRECILLVVCNSGRRSVHAARLLRELGYDRTFSVADGIRTLNLSTPQDQSP